MADPLSESVLFGLFQVSIKPPATLPMQLPSNSTTGAAEKLLINRILAVDRCQRGTTLLSQYQLADALAVLIDTFQVLHDIGLQGKRCHLL